MIATVNGDSITTRDLETTVRYQRFSLINQYIQYYQYYTAVGQDPTTQSETTQLTTLLNDSNTLGSQVLDKMIDDITIKQQAKALGITVTTQEVDQAMQAAFAFYPNGTSTPAITLTPWLTPTLNPTEPAIITPIPTATDAPTAVGTPTSTQTATPTNTPQPTSTPYTLAGYQAAVSTVVAGASNHGVPGFSEAELRSLIETQVYRQKVQDYVTKDIPVDQDQVWVRHIVQADQASAAAVETRLKNGENWATIALTLSTDSATKSHGGDMGWFPKGIEDPVLENAAFTATVGQISDPIQTQAGWEVFQVVGHETRPVDLSTLQTLKSNSFQTWLTNARAKITIVKNNNWNQRIPVDPTIDPTDLLVPTQAVQ